MIRQILIVLGVALASAAGFGLLLGLLWMVLHLVNGEFPYILAGRFHAMSDVLPALFAVVAFVGGAWAASSLVSRHNKNSPHRHLPFRP